MRACGYDRPDRIAGVTLEEFLSTCRVSATELRLVNEWLAQAQVSFRPAAIRYPFINPLLQREVAAVGVDVSQTSITTIGLPAWAEEPLLAGGIETIGQLLGSSTFYIRLVLGHGGRPQSILRQQVEDHLIRLLRSVRDPQAEGDVGSTLDQPRQGLPLQPRTLNALRRAGIFTLAQLQRLSEDELGRLRGLGPKGRAEILAVLASGRQQSHMVTPAADIAVQAEALTIRPEVAGRPVGRLDLPQTLVRRLESAGIERIGDLVEGGQNPLRSIPRVGRASEQRIRAALEQYLLGTLEEVGDSVPEIVAEVQASSAGSTLDERIRELIGRLRSERLEHLLAWRFGLDGHVVTLEEVGRELGISRERARQLERNSLLRLRREHPGEIESLTRPAHEALAAVGGVAPLGYMLEQLPLRYHMERIHVFGAARFLLEIAEGYERLRGGLVAVPRAPLDEVASLDDFVVTLLRKRLEPISVTDLTADTARLPSYAAILKQYPSFSLSARARANPDTQVLPSGAVALKEWTRTRLDNVVSALRALGQPSHYRRIAAQVGQMAPQSTSKGPVSVEVVHNLLLQEAAFTRVGRGVFGLAEWQQQGSDVAARIERLLGDADHRMHYSEVAQALDLPERVVERCLIAAPQFSPAGRGRYGLAGRQYPRRPGATRKTGDDAAASRATVQEAGLSARGGPYVRVRISRATYRSGTLALNAALLPLFPHQGDLPATWPGSHRPEARHRLHRGRSHISGLRRFLQTQGVRPEESIYIERVDDGQVCYGLYTEAQWRAAAISNRMKDEKTAFSTG